MDEIVDVISNTIKNLKVKTLSSYIEEINNFVDKFNIDDETFNNTLDQIQKLFENDNVDINLIISNLKEKKISLLNRNIITILFKLYQKENLIIFKHYLLNKLFFIFINN